MTVLCVHSFIIGSIETKLCWRVVSCVVHTRRYGEEFLSFQPQLRRILLKAATVQQLLNNDEEVHSSGKTYSVVLLLLIVFAEDTQKAAGDRELKLVCFKRKHSHHSCFGLGVGCILRDIFEGC